MAQYRPNNAPNPNPRQGGPPASVQEPATYVHPSPYAWAPDQGYHHQSGCDSCLAARQHLRRYHPTIPEAADAERQRTMFEDNIRQMAHAPPSSSRGFATIDTRPTAGTGALAITTQRREAPPGKRQCLPSPREISIHQHGQALPKARTPGQNTRSLPPNSSISPS